MGQAINENSIDDFTQEELQIIVDAFFNYEIALQQQEVQQISIKPVQKIFIDYVNDVHKLQKKVAGFINS
ncbi:hypothetical protein [Psychrobacter sp. AT9]|uniref:hypothetical protein n=1 Tax=Psychrobacter sp. AT9 TaxID=3242893 RepID=UPI0039A64859